MPEKPEATSTKWHQLNRREVADLFGVREDTGLSETEAERRLVEFGGNELADPQTRSPWAILWEQLTALLVVMLIVAAIVSAFLGDYGDAGAIGVIVVLNAALAFYQEYQAERAMVALKKLASPTAQVRRDAQTRKLPAIKIVPGDVLLLEAGNVVPADCRIIQSRNLCVQEAALTGESQPVQKTESVIGLAEISLPDRRNMAYMGTSILSGRGLAIVTETGMRSELGRIAEMIHGIQREATPLQRRLAGLAKRLAAAAFVIVTLIFILGIARGESLKLMFLTAVSVAVAAVPEGLPAVVTIVLTLGARRMLKRNVLIRKLAAVETLGSVTTICSDKTGTLTENQMTVEILQLADQRLDIRGQRAIEASRVLPATTLQRFRFLLMGGTLCNDVTVPSTSPPSANTVLLGDPTETALISAASSFHLNKGELEKIAPRVGEIPFSSERKRMVTFHEFLPGHGQLPNEAYDAFNGALPAYVAFMKGSVEALLELSATVRVGDLAEPLDERWRTRLLAANDGFAANGMRVIGVACRGFDSVPADLLGSGEADGAFTFIGMIALADPPRAEVPAAVAACKTGGIRPIMITGDHPFTAQFIAARVGIEEKGTVLTGSQMDALSQDALKRLAASTSIYARVAPKHKLELVEALQAAGEIVAMTGDGVNDAPALKKSDIGVAMGATGSDVAKQAADMVLLDDNFASIVSAVEEGRVIYDNIRKFIRYILATNSGEIWVMLMAPVLGMPIPLLPIQILWMNLVTDGLPALALSVEPPEGDLMSRRPRPPRESVFARGLGRHVMWVGILMGFLSLSLAVSYWRTNNPNWQTVLFTTLTLSQMSHILAIRSERESLWHLGVFSNKPLLGAVALTVTLQFAIVYLPAFQHVFKTKSLSLADLVLTGVFSSVVFCAVEFEKWRARKRSS